MPRGCRTKRLSRSTTAFQIDVIFEQCNWVLEILVESLRSIDRETAIRIAERMDVGYEGAKCRRDQRLRDLEVRRRDVDVLKEVIEKDKHGNPIEDKNGHLSPHIGPPPESKRDHLKNWGIAFGVHVGLID